MNDAGDLITRLGQLEGPPVDSVPVAQVARLGRRRIRRRKGSALLVGGAALALVVWGAFSLAVHRGPSTLNETFTLGAGRGVHVTVTVLDHGRHTKRWTSRPWRLGSSPTSAHGKRLGWPWRRSVARFIPGCCICSWAQ